MNDGALNNLFNALTTKTYCLYFLTCIIGERIYFSKYDMSPTDKLSCWVTLGLWFHYQCSCWINDTFSNDVVSICYKMSFVNFTQWLLYLRFTIKILHCIHMLHSSVIVFDPSWRSLGLSPFVMCLGKEIIVLID